MSRTVRLQLRACPQKSSFRRWCNSRARKAMRLSSCITGLWSCGLANGMFFVNGREQIDLKRGDFSSIEDSELSWIRLCINILMVVCECKERSHVKRWQKVTRGTRLVLVGTGWSW